jgi:hypothetical protein
MTESGQTHCQFDDYLQRGTANEGWLAESKLEALFENHD